jgi:hemoglobin
MNPSLYVVLGGEAAVDVLVLRFYRKVMTDARVSHFFSGINMDSQIEKQKAFLNFLLGGLGQYTGKSLREAHAPLLSQGLNDMHFDAVAEHLQATLEEMGVTPSEITQVMTIVAGARNDILNR